MITKHYGGKTPLYIIQKEFVPHVKEIGTIEVISTMYVVLITSMIGTNLNLQFMRNTYLSKLSIFN